MVAALVPVKNLDFAKSRLASILSTVERKKMVSVMLETVLSAAFKCPEITEVFIVADRYFTGVGGTTIIVEESNRGYNEAITAALDNDRLANNDAMIIIPCDLPLIRAEDLGTFIKGFKRNGIRIAPARDEEGTNALLLSPPHIMKTQFGKGSFLKHRQEAKRVTSDVAIVSIPGLAFDIDKPQDLIDFCKDLSDTATCKFVQESGILNRLLT